METSKGRDIDIGGGPVLDFSLTDLIIFQKKKGCPKKRVPNYFQRHVNLLSKLTVSVIDSTIGGWM